MCEGVQYHDDLQVSGLKDRGPCGKPVIERYCPLKTHTEAQTMHCITLTDCDIVGASVFLHARVLITAAGVIVLLGNNQCTPRLLLMHGVRERDPQFGTRFRAQLAWSIDPSLVLGCCAEGAPGHLASRSRLLRSRRFSPVSH